jgi:hypothetical protein
MPWLLSKTLDQRHVSWFPTDADWKSISGVRTGDDDYVHDPADPDLRFRQDSRHKVLPDLMGGWPSGAIFVSRRLRDMIEEMEPFRHRYTPLILRTCDGRISDGVIEEKSDVGLMGERHERLAAYGTPAHPTITWKAAAIAGHHVFTDKYLRRRIFVSDEFRQRMKRDKILTSFKEVQSFAE